MTKTAYDAIVVGARCAGAAAAICLARAGLRVLLTDRGAFPSDIPHGHFIRRHGPARLRRWGLLDHLLATGCPPIATWLTDLDDGVVVANDLVVDGVPSAIGPRRTVLDALLVDVAIASGAEFRERWSVEEVIRDGDRVVGIRGREAGTGNLSAEHTTITVGADGRRSKIARLVTAEVLEYRPAMTCWYFSYWSGIESPGLELYQRNASTLFAFPTSNGLFAVFAAWPASRLEEVRVAPARSIEALVAEVPSLADRMCASRRVERISGATDLPNFRRRAAGPGWALVGDAACHKDPYLALGICDALRDAEFLAHSVTTRRSIDAALAEYDRTHDAATQRDFAENIRRAALGPVAPAVLRLRSALRRDPAAARAFHLATEGMIDPEHFFNVTNLRALVGNDVPAPLLETFAANEVSRVRYGNV